MVDKLGPILQSHAEGLSEEQTLAILLLATSTLNAFDHMMTRMSYSSTFLPEKRDDYDAIQLEEIVAKHSPSLFGMFIRWQQYQLNKEPKMTKLDAISRLLAVIRRNLQRTPLSSLPSTAILAVFPLFSLLNHSCLPNAVLRLRLPSCSSSFSPEEPRNVGALIHLLDSPVYSGEEITISYLSDICVSRLTSHKLLGFLRECKRWEQEKEEDEDEEGKEKEEWVDFRQHGYSPKQVLAILSSSEVQKVIYTKRVAMSCLDYAMKHPIRSAEETQIIGESCFAINGAWNQLGLPAHPCRIPILEEESRL